MRLRSIVAGVVVSALFPAALAYTGVFRVGDGIPAAAIDRIAVGISRRWRGWCRHPMSVWAAMPAPCRTEELCRRRGDTLRCTAMVSAATADNGR
jgi:hypothetical protein